MVGVEECKNVPVPAECECPADKYNDQYDCKHKVALATIGGPPVLKAAVNYERSAATSPIQDSEMLADKLTTDGGAVTAEAEPEACPNGDERCDGPDGNDLPCFACFEGDRA